MNQLGWRQRDIAHALSAGEGTFNRWLAKVRPHGPEAMRSPPIPGPRPRLPDQQRRQFPEFLWHGAEAYTFSDDAWTYARMAHVLKEEFGISYSKSQVSRILKNMGWTPQVPITRAF